MLLFKEGSEGGKFNKSSNEPMYFDIAVDLNLNHPSQRWNRLRHELKFTAHPITHKPRQASQVKVPVT